MPSIPAKTADPGVVEVTVAKEQLGWVRDLPQPLSGHLEHADLVGGAEPVLDSSQDTERVAAVALEVEDCVDHVLDHLGSGDLALFGDMADEHQCAALRFGEANQRLRCGANLAYGAGGCFERLGPKRLDGIDDDQIGPPTLGKRGQDVGQVGFRGERHRRSCQPEPFGPQTHLRDGFLTREVDDALTRCAERRCDLQQQCRFTDSRLAADEQGGTGHDPAAGYAIELRDAGR